MSSRSFRVGLTLTFSLLVLLLLFLPVTARGGSLASDISAPMLAPDTASGYTFSYTTTTYTEITGTTSTATGDDGAENLTLPFTFRYDGVNYTTARVSTNGWLEMGTSFTGSGFSNDLASTTSKPLLAPLWDDLYDDATSVISYTTLGTAPDRIFVVQWENIRWQLSGGTQQNFQVRLYETSNVVEFVYGTMNTPTGSPSASIGINDAVGGSGRFLSVTPGNPPTVSSTTANNSISSITFLTSGTTYRFTPPPPAPDYSTSTKSVSPSGTRFSGDVVTYTVVVLNSGDLTGAATTLDDPIPSGAAYVPGSAVLTGSGTLTATASSIDWNGSLAPTERVTVTFQVTLTAINGSVTNTATISDPLIAAPVIKSVNTPIQIPNYSTSTKVVSPNVHPGQRATYTVTLINSGLVAGTSTTLSDPIPAGAAYVDGSAQVAGGGTLTATASSIDWSGSVAPSGRVTVTFQVTLTAQSGSVVNTATINDPLLLAPVVKSATTAIQPPIGGPDAGGYTYKDSYAVGGPTFTWVFTTGASTQIPSFTGGNDDGYAQIPLGFDFRFYTGVYSQAFAATNGFLRFGTGSSEFSNVAIPNSSAPNNFAACLWDDQQILGGQGIWYETFGVAPNRYTVVTWHIQDYNSGTLLTPYDYQMILYEGTNQIVCQYLAMTSVTVGDGREATIGIENATGTTGVQYSADKNPGPIENNLAIRFDPGVGYAASAKSVQPTGSVTPGQVLTYTVVVANGGALTGTATMNDPIPAGMTYVPGTAALTGGGTLTATGSAVDWGGSLVSGDRVTVTFRVTVTAISGAITNTAVISDPLLVAPVVKTASNPIVCNLPAGLSFTYDPLAPLANQTIDFSGTVVSGLQPFAYMWNFADSSPLGAGNPITHAYTTAATYNVVMTVTNVCGANSYTAPITVTSGPTPPALGPLQSSSPTALGNATFFTGTLLGGSVPITYTWDFGDSTIVVDGLTINHTYTSTGSYIALLTADNVSGTATVSTTVNVGIPPTASFDATNPTFYPATTVFTYTGNPGTPPTTYLWNFGDGVTSTLQNPSHAYAAPLATNNYTVTLNVGNDFGSAVTSTVVTVLNTSADLSISKSDSPDPVPGGTPLTYTLSVTNGGPTPVMGAPIASFPFTNSALIAIPSSGAGTPYPSTINVSGITDLVGQVTATLYGISHTFPDDIDVLLVSPGGQKLLLLSDAGGSADVSNVTLTFDDNAASFVPDSGPLVSGTFKPTNYGTGDTFPAPAPAGPYASALSTFAGVNPNGTWSLFVVDDASGDSGAINGGWSLNFTTVQPVTTTVVDTLPAGYGFGSATGAGWSCANNAGTVTCTRSVFPVGRAPDIVITGNAPTLASSGPITNTASVSSQLSDLNPINNTTTITTFVNALRSDLSVVKTGTPSVAALNSTVTYQITATNGGPDATTGVIVTDTLPNGMAFASATGGCSYAAGKVTCLVGNMANGATFNASIVVTATTYGTFTNTVSVVGDNPDLTPGNNTATASTSVVWPEISAAPGSFTAMQAPNKVTTQTLTISNVGVVPLNWLLSEYATLFRSAYVPEPELAPREVTEADRIETIDAKAEKSYTAVPGSAPITPFVPEAVLYNNGPFVNLPGGGAGGADASVLQSNLGLGTYGWGHAVSSGFRVADDFTIPAQMTWNISGITFFAYQTGSTLASTITAVNYRIWDGVPGAPGSQVVFGDTTTNRLSATTWSGAYRVLDTALTGTTRPIMADTTSAGVILPPGHYWLDWQTDGTLASGPWAPPIAISGTTTTGNALQYDPTAGAWNPVTDTVATQTQGFPFIIQGTVSSCTGNIPWLSASPISGTTAPGSNSGVSLVFNSTGLTTGVYTGTLCLTSNDYDTSFVQIPVSLTVKLYSIYLPVIRR